MISLKKFLNCDKCIVTDELGYDIKYPICLFKLFTPEEDIIFVLKERYQEDLESALINLDENKLAFDENKFAELFLGLYHISDDTFYFSSMQDMYEHLDLIDASELYLSSLSITALKIIDKINTKTQGMFLEDKIGCFDESNIGFNDLLNYIRNGDVAIENMFNSYIQK